MLPLVQVQQVAKPERRRGDTGMGNIDRKTNRCDQTNAHQDETLADRQID